LLLGEVLRDALGVRCELASELGVVVGRSVLTRLGEQMVEELPVVVELAYVEAVLLSDLADSGVLGLSLLPDSGSGGVVRVCWASRLSCWSAAGPLSTNAWLSRLATCRALLLSGIRSSGTGGRIGNGETGVERVVATGCEAIVCGRA
jgi:hypothetical protein